MPNYFDYISDGAEKYDEPDFIEESVNDTFNDTIADMDLYCFQESLVVAGAIVGIAVLIGLIVALIKKMIDVFSTSSKSIDKKTKDLERSGVTAISVNTNNNSVNNNVSVENGVKYVNEKSIEYVDFTKGIARDVKEKINKLFENTTYYLTLVIETGDFGLVKISEKMKEMYPEGNDNFVTYSIKDKKLHHEGDGIRIGQSLFVRDIVDNLVGDYKKCVSTTDKLSLGTLHTCNRVTKEFIDDLKKNQRDLSKLKKEVAGRSRSGNYNNNMNREIKDQQFRKNMTKITKWYTGIENVNNKLGTLL